MAHADLRDFIQAVEARGELKHVAGANWDVEMGSIVELIYREGKHPKPAVMFDETTGYAKGFRNLFGVLGSTWRIARTLGLPEDKTDPMSVADSWYKKSREIRRIPPKFVTSGPVLENSLTGDKVDVLKFPVPRFHELDKGRYFGTAHCVIQQDPDEGWVNCGTYRVMVVDNKTMALHATPGKHGNIMTYEKYFARKKVMPIAIAVGLDPVLWWLSCQTDTPWGVSEYDAAGGIKGEPLEVIKGEYTGLPFPARAEVVVEGECHPGEFVDEGPFGEWHGYYANRGLLPVPEPVIRVKAIYYRNNPIFTCSQPAVPPHTFTLMLAVADSVAIRRRLEAFGIPGVKSVWAHYTGSGGLFNVISIQQLYSGHARQVGLIASQYPAECGAYTVVVEEDIDPSNLDQVLWAMVTRARLDRQIEILPYCHTNNVHPAIPLKEKRATEHAVPLTAARVVIDACRDLSWKNDWYPIARMSPELRTKLLEKWKSVFSGVIG
ncbi:MAG: UbiD family decarboxylase [Dehalococcoidia bacterium]|nr:UbiD family decarboxylase [Dehalococcoidia bacterium]